MRGHFLQIMKTDFVLKKMGRVSLKALVLITHFWERGNLFVQLHGDCLSTIATIHYQDVRRGVDIRLGKIQLSPSEHAKTD